MNRAVFVTGGAQGIGKCLVRHFLERGWAAAFADLDREAGEETAAEYAALGPVLFVPADVACEADVASGIAAAVQRFGALHALINNAAIGIGKPPTELTLAEWNRVLAVNLTGPFLCAKHAAPHLRATRGAILNVASTRAFMSEANTEAYSASKGGLVSLTHALAVSLGPDIRVNAIAPGWIEVSAWKKKALRREPVLSEADHRQHPAGRVGRPEDIAALAFHLLSDDAGFITGLCFTVDGGMTRRMIYI
jgi:NAD(P)-dependent dehydrogenase (short-subunit alcohol dehydrogenase family)